MDKRSSQATTAIIKEANEWLIQLTEHASDATPAAFAEWLRRSPVHVREYLRAETTWSALEGIDRERKIDIETLLKHESSNVVEFSTTPAGATKPQQGLPLWRRSLFAAAMLAVGIGFIWYLQQPDSVYFDTGLGEQRRLVLDDGSVVELNTLSAIEVRLSETLREVELLRGEALFTVAKDAARPFVVTSDLAVVRAIGTQFNVYRQPNQTVVTVLEGRVLVDRTERRDSAVPDVGETAAAKIEPIELAAGNQAEVVAKLPIRRVSVNTERVVAWRERRLIFDNQPLTEVVAEFNRYNARQLVVTDPQLGAKRISGVFDADHPDALVRFLLQNAAIETVDAGGAKLVIDSLE